MSAARKLADPAATPLPQLPPAILERLRGHGIHSCEDWQGLSRSKQRAIWGIPGASVELINRAVAGALKQGVA
jgi:hypothetical protein